MEWLISSVLMGLAGSVHCMGMCGPLVMSLEVASGKKGWARSRWMYHLGRTLMYSLLGVIMGWVGMSASSFGFQRWVVLLSGALMLILLVSPAWMRRVHFLTIGPRIRDAFVQRMKNNALGARLVLGMLNGLLPCGLVYVALAASLATASWWQGAVFMMLFGVATAPALFFVAAITRWLGARLRTQSMRWVQLGLVAMAFLVLLRGANLGIPFLSPVIKTSGGNSCCSTVHPE